MGIKWYKIADEEYCDISVNRCSKRNRRIRAQRKRTKLQLTKSQAEKLHMELIVEVSLEVGRRESQEMLWLELIEKWELDQIRGKMRRPLDKKSRQDVVNRLLRYTKQIHKTHISKLKACDIEDCLEIAKAGGASLGLRQLIRWSVNTVYTYGMRQKFIQADKSICKDVHVLAGSAEEQAEKIPLILNKKEIKEFISKARETEHPWFPMWFTALYTGMRTGELNALRKSKIELVSKEEALKLDKLEDSSKKYYGKIQVEKAWKKSLKKNGPTKGRWWRTVPLNSKLYWFLVDYLETDNGSDEDGERVFPRINKWDDGKQAAILRFFLEEIGVKSVTFHTLRACFCTQMLEAGVDRASIMKIGGWKSEEVMQLYIRLAGVDERGKTENLDFGFSSSAPEREQHTASIGANVINLFGK